MPFYLVLCTFVLNSKTMTHSFTISNADPLSRSLCQFLRIANTLEGAETKARAVLDFLKWKSYIVTIFVIEDGSPKIVKEWKK